MKDYYKINEISKLSGIGIDSLRYYEEIGILKPRRGDNRYRLYSLKDIYKLNIIRDLRSLDFSMKQIKDYLDYQSVSHTIELLQEEQEVIEKQLESLNAAKLSICSRMENIWKLSNKAVNEFTIVDFPERLCLRLNAEIRRDEETDFAIKKLHRKYEDKIRELGDQAIGAIPSMEAFYNGENGVFNSVFFILDGKTEEYDFVLPAGRYLSVFYRGGYEQSYEKIRGILSYAENNNIKITMEPFELYHIDNRYTMREEEFLTEIQVHLDDSNL